MRPNVLILVSYLHILGMQGELSGQSVNKQLEKYRSILADRLEVLSHTDIDIPVIIYQPQLPANARYHNDTIWLGTVQRDYHTLGDTLSIIYHEYLHKTYRGLSMFPVRNDEEGNPVQWETHTFYRYNPLDVQVNRDVENLRRYYRKTYPTWSEEQIAQQLVPLKVLLTESREIPFRYAPSNLALEEIKAYEEQLDGENQGLYKLSTEARNSILIRLHQLRQTYQLRIEYEDKHDIGRDGTKSHLPK